MMCFLFFHRFIDQVQSNRDASKGADVGRTTDSKTSFNGLFHPTQARLLGMHQASLSLRFYATCLALDTSLPICGRFVLAFEHNPAPSMLIEGVSLGSNIRSCCSENSSHAMISRRISDG